MSYLKYCTKGIYKSSINIDNKEIIYAISISKHVYKERYITAKKTESRLFDEFDIEKFNYIIQPHIKDMIDKPNKYVIKIPYKRDSDLMLYLLVTFEKSIKKKDEYYIKLITTYKKSNSNITFLRIPIKNRLMSNYYYYEIIFNKNF